MFTGAVVLWRREEGSPLTLHYYGIANNILHNGDYSSLSLLRTQPPGLGLSKDAGLHLWREQEKSLGSDGGESNSRKTGPPFSLSALGENSNIILKLFPVPARWLKQTPVLGIAELQQVNEQLD